MKNKFIIPTISILSLLLISGVAYTQLNKPEQKIVTNLNLSSSSQSVSAIKSQLAFSSAQLSSSSVVVSSSEVAKVVEVPKASETKNIIEIPNSEQIRIESLRPKIIQTPEFKLFYKFNDKNKSGGQSISESDITFLNNNIQDLANYYFAEVKNLFPSNDRLLNAYKFQKLDNSSYVIQMSIIFNPSSGEGAVLYPNPKTYKLTKTSQTEGELKELSNFIWSEDSMIQATAN